MQPITLTRLRFSLLASVFFLSGFLACTSTPLVDKTSLYHAVESKDMSYLTSQSVKMLSSAFAAAEEYCTLAVSGSNSHNKTDSTLKAYSQCLSDHYNVYALEFKTYSAIFQYSACRADQKAEAFCREKYQKTPLPKD